MDHGEICLTCGHTWGAHYTSGGKTVCSMPSPSGGTVPNNKGWLFAATNLETVCSRCKIKRGSHYPRGSVQAGDRLCPKILPDGSKMPNTTGQLFSVVGAINVTIKTLSRECPCGIFRADCIYHA